MSKRDKLINRLFNHRNPKLTYEEAKNLLIHFGFEIHKSEYQGKLKSKSGSHRSFVFAGNNKGFIYCRIHEPHGKGDNFLDSRGIKELRRAVGEYQTYQISQGILEENL